MFALDVISLYLCKDTQSYHNFLCISSKLFNYLNETSKWKEIFRDYNFDRDLFPIKYVERFKLLYYSNTYILDNGMIYMPFINNIQYLDECTVQKFIGACVSPHRPFVLCEDLINKDDAEFFMFQINKLRTLCPDKTQQLITILNIHRKLFKINIRRCLVSLDFYDINRYQKMHVLTGIKDYNGYTILQVSWETAKVSYLFHQGGTRNNECLKMEPRMAKILFNKHF